MKENENRLINKHKMSHTHTHARITENKNKSIEANGGDNVLFQFMDDCAEDIE